MESHILNMYHQGPYRSIEDDGLRSISESVSSESSCNHNSPEYSQNQQTSQECESDDGEYWDQDDRLHDSRDEDVNVSDSYQDDEEYIQVDNPLQPVQVIQVIVINPENEADVDDIELKCTNENDDENYNAHDEDKIEDTVSEEDSTELIQLNELGIDEDTPVVSNVDEYFVMKQNNESDILEVRDEPIVQDVDEYFIKDTQESKSPPKENNITKDESEGIDFRIPNSTEAFSVIDNDSKIEEHYSDVEQDDPNISINESDLEGLPNIEDLKRYILDDMPCIKIKNSHKCSVSLPHSPMHNICMDMDSKTCLSFEDLNLDLSDLTMENKGKSENSKTDDIPRALTEEDINSFLITSLNKQVIYEKEDDLSHQDMELDKTVGSIIQSNSPPYISTLIPQRKCTSTPIPGSNAALDFGTDKSADVKDSQAKADVDDFVDVESCNEIAIPVLKANNLNSLLEQFEATEKLNDGTKIRSINDKNMQVKTLLSGMRLQEAGIKLNKTKMRQILMPSTVKTSIKASNPDYSDHNYCSKKRHSLPSLKGGQSLLKPEVLSSNNKILSSRHRSCKDKKVVYHLSSDEESDTVGKKNKMLNSRSHSGSDTKIKKTVDKQTFKSTLNLNTANIHKKTPQKIKHTETENISTKVIHTCDTDSQNSNYRGSIKLTIKNKSEVIIKNCEPENDIECDSVNDKPKSDRLINCSENAYKENMESESDIVKIDNSFKTDDKSNLSTDNSDSVSVKEEVSSNPEDFYNALFTNKQDVCIPQSIKVKSEDKNKDDDVQVVSEEPALNILEQPQKKRKLNLHEYKLRRGASSNNNSAQVSPEAIFPDLPPNVILDKNIKSNFNPMDSKSIVVKKENDTIEIPKTVFDPIREASRKIIMISKKQKADAMRKRDEDIVMSKIPKVENLELQPLMSDSEMMKMVGFTPEVVPPPTVTEKNQVSKEFDEIVLVSIGTNTDENLLKCSDKPIVKKRKSLSPPVDKKYTINFKIKKYDHVLRKNVFDPVKRDAHIEDINHSEAKIDNERFKDITATIKSVEKQVDTKISSNSLFASIQDVVKKKAPISKSPTHGEHKSSKLISPVEKREVIKFRHTPIVREYDVNADHGEDKVILHLEKDRMKPDCHIATTQTESSKVLKNLANVTDTVVPKEQAVIPRKRNDSDMSVSSDDSPMANNKEVIAPVRKEVKTAVVKPKIDPKKSSRSRSKDKRSRSRERYDVKYRRSRSHSRGHRRKRSHSRNRSRSRGRFQRYRRSDSPYRRRRRSRTRSPYRRRSPSIRRDHRTNRTRSRSRHNDRKKSRSPIKRQIQKHSTNNSSDKKPAVSLTPPLRKTSVSETSDTSTSSSTSSSSSSSASEKSRASSGSFIREEAYRNKTTRSFSSEDRESNTPVEERRIVFVGKLEKDLTKGALRTKFSKFGPVTEVRLHSKEDGSRYGFVTYQRPRDAWSAVEAASTFPQYDVGFGGRRAFCRQSYADLDGLEAKYTESAFHGQQTLPARRNDDMSFEQMLLDMKNKLNKRKGERNRFDDDPTA